MGEKRNVSVEIKGEVRKLKAPKKPELGKKDDNSYGIDDVEAWHEKAENTPLSGIDLSLPKGDRD